ncbi:hypothetical protein ALI22I_29630 [Saccharothrix sp. ALI-22-I]|nr:hypothetical protein ALI22I_29630 [Saccharothrix sp. ALI-22-I]
MSGRALLSRATVRNVRIRLASQPAWPGPASGVRVSRLRMRCTVRTHPALKSPALAVSQVQSGSFQTSHATTLLTESRPACCSPPARTGHRTRRA